MKTCPDCGCRVHEYGCINCNEADYIDMQNLDDILNQPCGRCGDPTCFGGCELTQSDDAVDPVGEKVTE